MLFKNSALALALLSLSFHAFSQEQGNSKVTIDARALILQAEIQSKNMGLEDIVERSKSVDFDAYNIEGLREVMVAELDQTDLVERTIDGFSEVIADEANTRNMNPLQAISGLANENEARNREEMLNFLGLSEKKNHLYIFVSYSMSEDMIAAYSREAMWAGASLIVKGLEEGKDIGEFIQSKAKKLLGGKGYTAALHFDPRLFDAFQIDYVPTIVLADENFIEYCEDSGERLSALNKTKKCKSRPDDRFIKISGAVTLDYALEQFIEEGSFKVEAEDRLTSLRENIGRPDFTEQVEVYDFDDKLLPHQKKKLYDEYSKFGEVIDTELGISVIPFEAPKRMGVHFKRHSKPK